MANSITIDIDAKDNASGIISGVFELVKNGASAFDVVATAAIAAGNFIANATQEAFAYDQQILGLSLSTGQNTEATSRMVQVLDDAGIGFDTVKKAMREMAKDGTEPNIQELARLSDEFKSLNSGAERGKFLMDNFGKSGEEMARVMALGGDNILSMNDAIEGNLIVTAKAAAEAEEYRMNVDALNDTWQSFKIGIGNAVIPIINDLNANMASHAAVVDFVRKEYADLAPYQQDKIIRDIEERNAAIAASDAVASHGDALDGVVTSTQNLAAATALTTEEIKAMSVANNAQFSLIGKLQGITDDYNKTLAETTEKYGENSEEVQRLEAEHSAAMQKIAFDLYIAKLAAGGFTDAEYAMAVAAGVATGQIDQATADMAMALDETAQHAIDLGTDIQNVGDVAEGISGVYELEFHSTLTGQWPTTYTEVPDDFTGPLCFISGTKVWAGNEHKNIEDLQIGDFVRSYDTEAKELVDVSIAQIFRRKVSSYLLINRIGVTHEHPFYANGVWVKAMELKLGDVLLSEEGKDVFVTEISHIEKDATVYNIHTSTEPHNYFAGGVLVHNKDAKMGASGGSPYAVQSGSMGMFSASDAAMIGQAVAAHIAPLLK